jgi:hypothetical protein
MEIELEFDKFIYNTFVKVHGFSIQKDALEFLIDILSQLRHDETLLLDAIDMVISAYQKMESTLNYCVTYFFFQLLCIADSNIMTRSILEKVVQHFIKKSVQDQQGEFASHIEVIDVFTIPKYIYNTHQKYFELCPKSGKLGLLGNAEDKFNMFRERYIIIKQRLLTTEIFQSNEEDDMKVTRIVVYSDII